MHLSTPTAFADIHVFCSGLALTLFKPLGSWFVLSGEQDSPVTGIAVPSPACPTSHVDGVVLPQGEGIARLNRTVCALIRQCVCWLILYWPHFMKAALFPCGQPLLTCSALSMGLQTPDSPSPPESGCLVCSSVPTFFPSPHIVIHLSFYTLMVV